MQFFMLSYTAKTILSFKPVFSTDEKNICYREECLHMADDILETMDTSIPPCQNFYQYACGGWLNRQFLNPERKKVSTFASHLPWELIRKMLAEPPKPTDHIAVQNAKKFYASCVRYPYGTKAFNNAAVKLVLGLDALDATEYQRGHVRSFNVELALIAALQLGVHPLFELRADPSSFTDPEKRRQRSNLYISKPALGMPYDRYEFLRDSKVLRDKYASELLYPLQTVIYVNNKLSEAWKHVRSQVDVEVTLARMYNDLPNKGTTVNMTLEQLTAFYGKSMDWTRFVSMLTSSPELGITDITPEEVVIVRDPEHLQRIFKYFVALPDRTKFNYIFTRVFSSLEYALIEDHKKADFFLSATKTRKDQFQHREQGCVMQTSQMFDLVVYRLLYLNYLKNEPIRKSINLKMAWRFAALVNSQDWMSANTMDKMAEKFFQIISTGTVLAFHANAMNDSLLESYYANITGDEYMESLGLARNLAFVRDMKNIRRTTEADPPSFPHQFVVKYHRHLNKIDINPLVLHEPFFNVGYESLRFASFGSVLAQEMMHGFDTTGIHYNKDGAHGNWLPESEVQAFNARAQCLVEQYNYFTYRPTGMRVNGTSTLDSNIADAIGLKIAYNAYSSYHSVEEDLPLLPGVNLTNEQIFFVKFAQMRCTKESREAAVSTMSGQQSPDEFRVNGPLRNLQEFAAAFRCPANTYMNPRHKCVVW
ncbi:hypothetical protein BsWGS_17239 [Bradybaena similaris]